MPDLNKLLGLIEEMPAYCRLVGELKQRSGIARAAVLEAAKPYLIASLYYRLPVPMLLVTAEPENAIKLYEQLLSWCGSSPVKLFPEPGALPYERFASDNSVELERLQVLSALANIDKDENPQAVPPIIVVSAPAFMEKIPPYREFMEARYSIRAGMIVAFFDLLGRLPALGYWFA